MIKIELIYFYQRKKKKDYHFIINKKGLVKSKEKNLISYLCKEEKVP